MRFLQLLSSCGLVMGFSAIVLAQDIDEDEVQDQTQAIVIVQKPPATKIEAFEQSVGVVLTKGLTQVGNLASDDEAETNLNVVFMKDSNDKKVYGVQVEIRLKDTRPVRCYIDEDEINPLIDALGKLSRVDKNTLPMDLIEGAYKTRGNLDIYNREINGGRAAVLRVTSISALTGQVRVARASFRVARLVEIVQQLNNAKGVINRLKE